MRAVSYSLHELGYTAIDLGKHGENKIRQIEIDLREWFEEYPNASVALYVSQPNTTVYLAATHIRDGIMVWPILGTYTAIPGFGNAEIVMTGAGGERMKSVTADIFVGESLSESIPSTPPDYMRPYVDQVAENAAKVEEAVEEIKGIVVQSGNMPTGGTAGDALVKRSNAYGDAAWKALTAADVGALGKNEKAADADKLNGKGAEFYATAEDVNQLFEQVTDYRTAVNLLDNSNFGDLIAQAGLGAWNATDQYTSGLHGNMAYAADRWTSYVCSVEKNDGYARLYAGMSSCRIAQVMPNVAGKTVKVAAKVVGSNRVFIGFYYNIGETETIGSVSTSAIAPNGIICKTGTVPSNAKNVQFRIYPAYDDGGDNYADVYWAAAYEGEYTAETLPPYAPKPYSVELAECQRYYVRLNAASELSFAGYALNSTVARFTIPLPNAMRSETPTLTVTYRSSVRLYPGDITPASINSVKCVGNVAAIVMTASGLTANVPLLMKPNALIELSADL